MRTPWPEIGGRIPLALLTPPPDLWRSLWSSDPAAAAAMRDEARRWSETGRRERVRILGELREILRVRHYSRRTEQAYTRWVARLFEHLPEGHPPAAVQNGHAIRFLSRLATEDRVSPATQNQALSAILFLMEVVLRRDPATLRGLPRARVASRQPAVLGRHEVATILGQLAGVAWLMASLLYGAGLRLRECCRLRVRDLDLAQGEITVRDGKGVRDRATVLPERLREPLRQHLARVRVLHDRDRQHGRGVSMPEHVERRPPEAAEAWGWQCDDGELLGARANLKGVIRRPVGSVPSKLPADPRCDAKNNDSDCGQRGYQRPDRIPLQTVEQFLHLAFVQHRGSPAAPVRATASTRRRLQSSAGGAERRRLVQPLVVRPSLPLRVGLVALSGA